MRDVDYHPDHWSALEARPDDVIAGATANAQPGYMRSVVHPELGVVAVVGLVVPYEGVGYAWARVGDAARGHGVGLTRAILRCLERARATLPLRQIRAQVHIDRPEYRQWLSMLGFEPESVKKGAAPDGGDLVEYVLWTSVDATATRLRLHRRRRRPTTPGCGRTIPAGRQTSLTDATLH